MKYSNNFERDYNWYLKWKDVFNFCGSDDENDKVIFDINGKSAKECFYLHVSTGKILPTSEPELLYSLYKCKGSINFHIKMWSESRGKFEMGSAEF